MVKYFGILLYRIGLVLGALLELTGIVALIFASAAWLKTFGGVAIVAGILVFGAGRACLYLLAGL
jgi:hypothetical protein